MKFVGKLNELYQHLLTGDDGKFSYSKASGFVGVFLLVRVIYLVYFRFYDFTDVWAQFTLGILGLAFGFRGGQRVGQFVSEGIGSIKKKGSKTVEEKIESKPPEKVVEYVPQHRQIGYFHTTDFSSGDGEEMSKDVFENILKLISNLNVLREELGVPIAISSGYRSEAHNAKEGGAKDSTHIHGLAADIKTRRRTPEEVFATIKRLRAEGKMDRGGLGIYSNRIHVDIRGTDVFWDER